jgi:hypothetical protein
MEILIANKSGKYSCNGYFSTVRLNVDRHVPGIILAFSSFE